MNTHTEFFTTTTSEDQDNYFTGETQSLSIPPKTSKKSHVASREYRLINGEFFQIISGVPSEVVRDQIKKRIPTK